MTVKAKRFRIGVEGATTDGREIQREWLEQMAASYNPAVYTALINLEHIKSYLPDSTFNRYGKVTAQRAASPVDQMPVLAAPCLRRPVHRVVLPVDS